MRLGVACWLLCRMRLVLVSGFWVKNFNLGGLAPVFWCCVFCVFVLCGLDIMFICFLRLCTCNMSIIGLIVFGFNN